MRSMTELADLLSSPNTPFAQWHPRQCGSLPIVINNQAKWFYQDSEITRIAMVKLFASVLCKEQAHYYLKTPIEKIAISVADAPFIIVSWRYEETKQGLALCCIDNIDRIWLVTREQPLVMRRYQGVNVPYLQLPNGCSARLARSVFYQWVEQIAHADERGYFVQSATERFYLE